MHIKDIFGRLSYLLCPIFSALAFLLAMFIWIETNELPKHKQLNTRSRYPWHFYDRDLFTNQK